MEPVLRGLKVAKVIEITSSKSLMEPQDLHLNQVWVSKAYRE